MPIVGRGGGPRGHPDPRAKRGEGVFGVRGGVIRAGAKRHVWVESWEEIVAGGRA